MPYCCNLYYSLYYNLPLASWCNYEILPWVLVCRALQGNSSCSLWLHHCLSQCSRHELCCSRNCLAPTLLFDAFSVLVPQMSHPLVAFLQWSYCILSYISSFVRIYHLPLFFFSPNWRSVSGKKKHCFCLVVYCGLSHPFPDGSLKTWLLLVCCMTKAPVLMPLMGSAEWMNGWLNLWSPHSDKNIKHIKGNLKKTGQSC